MSLVWGPHQLPPPISRDEGYRVAHIVGQLEATHVCDVLAQCVLPIHLPEWKRQGLHGACGPPRPVYSGPWPLTPAHLLLPFPRDFEKSLPPAPALHVPWGCELQLPVCLCMRSPSVCRGLGT